MPKRAAGLNARKAETLKRPGRHADGHGLYLVVQPSGAKSWVLLYTHNGKRHEKGLGGYPAVSLATARKLTLRLRDGLALGDDPLAQRAAVPTFGKLADDYVTTHEAGWRNGKHRQQWRNTLKTYAAPLHDKPVNQIDVVDVVNVLKPLWQEKPETASRLRGRIEAVLDAAKARGWRSGENPARWRGNLKHLLPKRLKLTRGHHTALPYAQMPAFMKDLGSRTGVAARALEFIVYTAARTGEALGARWCEIDIEGATWAVPAARMKAGREHRVPLSPAAMAVVEQMAAQRRTDAPDAMVFAGYSPDKALSSMATSALLERMGRAVTTHGFRSTFRDWAAECTSYPREIAEAALAHINADKVEAAYRRFDLFERRRELMNDWAAFLAGGTSEAEQTPAAGGHSDEAA